MFIRNIIIIVIIVIIIIIIIISSSSSSSRSIRLSSHYARSRGHKVCCYGSCSPLWHDYGSR